MNYIKKTLVAPQTQLKSIKIEKWFTMNGKKELIFLYSTDKLPQIMTVLHQVFVEICGHIEMEQRSFSPELNAGCAVLTVELCKSHYHKCLIQVETSFKSGL